MSAGVRPSRRSSSPAMESSSTTTRSSRTAARAWPHTRSRGTSSSSTTCPGAPRERSSSASSSARNGPGGRVVSDVVVLGAKRTPFGRFGGAMKALPIPLLGAHAARAALDDAGVSADMIDEVALGVILPGSDRSIARQLALHVGVPDDRTAYTVDRACCSSLTAFSLGARAIQVGDARLALVGGAENMSRVPYFLEDMRWGHRLGHIEIKDQLVISCPYTGVPRAVQAADEALRYEVDRAQQDAWALRSQRLAADAAAAGRFDDQIVPIEIEDGRGGMTAVAADENPRGDVTLERLAALPTVYGSKTVTAGNAPGLSTGACQLVIADAEAAASLGARPLATLVVTVGGSGP